MHSRNVENLESRCLFSVAPAAVMHPADVPAPITFGGKTKAVFTDADGSTVTISLKGPGTGTVNFATDAPANAASIDLVGVTAGSSVTVKGDTSIGGVSADGALRAFTGKTCDLAGTFTTGGSVRSLRLRTLSDATLNIGPGDAFSFVAGDVFDTSINSAAEIRSLKVSTWFDNVAPEDTITAPAVDSVSAKGDFFANITASSVGKVKIGGTLAGDIRSEGDITSVTAAAIGGVSVFAGLPVDATALPTTIDDFPNPTATIRSFTVKAKFTGAFTAGQIAAPSIGKASLGNVLTDNGGTAFGVAADNIGSISGIYDGSEKFKLKKLGDPSQSVTRNDLVIRVL